MIQNVCAWNGMLNCCWLTPTQFSGIFCKSFWSRTLLSEQWETSGEWWCEHRREVNNYGEENTQDIELLYMHVMMFANHQFHYKNNENITLICPLVVSTYWSSKTNKTKIMLHLPASMASLWWLMINQMHSHARLVSKQTNDLCTSQTIIK